MTVASQRMGMLTGIGNLSHNTVSGANHLAEPQRNRSRAVYSNIATRRSVALGFFFKNISNYSEICVQIKFEVLYIYVDFVVHEATLIHALSMFTLWCSKFSTEVPVKLIQWFKVSFLLERCTISKKLSAMGFTHFFTCRNDIFTNLILITDRIWTENLNVSRTQCLH